MRIKVPKNYLVRETSSDGSGLRDSIYVQGCSIHCKGCHNKFLQDFKEGIWLDTLDIANKVCLEQFIDGVSILGGDPMQQIESVLCLVHEIKERRPDFSIWVYTGYTLEQVLSFKNPKFKELLSLIDVLVDGPYIKDLPSDTFRGSSNQRILYRGTDF